MSRIRRALVAVFPVIWNGGFARRFLLAGTIMALALTGLAGPVAASAAPAAQPPSNSPPRIPPPGKPLPNQPGGVRAALGKPRSVPATRSGHLARTGRAVSLRALARTSPPAGGRAAHAAPSGPASREVGRASVTSIGSFQGFTQAEIHLNPPDPSATTNGSQILMAVNLSIGVRDTAGNVLCGGTTPLSQLLNTSEPLSDPRVEYDNVSHRFILAVTVLTFSPPATPAMYVAVTTGDDACGQWTVFRPNFPDFPAGHFIDEPMLGQDRRAVLFGVDAGDLTSSDFEVFAIPKANLYGNVATDFPLFHIPAGFAAEPVTNAGNPMIDSASAYFVATTSPDPQNGGYVLYRMDGSGSASPTLTLQAAILAPFFVPSDAPQPGTSTRLHPGDGRIPWSAVFDGSRIWFANTIALPDGSIPTVVRYGFFSLVGPSQVALARHGSATADFNPSIGIGLAPGGVETVFLNWAYTNAPAGIGVSDTVDAFLYNGGTLPSRFSTDLTLISTGSVLSDPRFGDFSSVAVDPATSDGTCALTAQQYIAVAGSWAVRIGRVCGQSQVTVPNVAGGTVDAARTALTAAFLRGDPTTTTTACDNGSQGLVVGSSPPAGQALGIGQEVTLVTCNRNVRVPGTTDDTVDVASSAIRSAGLAVGDTSSTHSCDVLPGLVVSTSPRAGSLVLIGTTVNLRVSSGPPRTGCQ